MRGNLDVGEILWHILQGINKMFFILKNISLALFLSELKEMRLFDICAFFFVDIIVWITTYLLCAVSVLPILKTL